MPPSPTTTSDAENRLLQQFLAFVSIDTPPRQELPMMEALAPQLEALGLNVQFDNADQAVGGNVGNLIATLPATREGCPSIFLSAHVDTVTSTAGMKPVVADGFVRSDGTTILGADDKAAVAAILEAVRHVVTHDIPHGEVQLLISICEEIGLKGAAAMDRSLIRSRLGYVFDSSLPVGGIITASPSHDRLIATIHGRRAHAGMRPEAGVSAIQIAAKAIAKMPLGRIDPETTANIGILRGGEATNIVADEVYFEAEARSLDDAKLEHQVGTMTAALHDTAAELGGRVDLKLSRHYGRFRLADDSEVVQLASRAIRSINLPLQIGSSGGGSDASIFNAFGIPSVVLGIGYRDIHTRQESIEIAELERVYRLAVALIEQAAAG